ncbi:MAG TPA: T9SS type A sorting domain-containing protein [Flavobacteriales bacterium]|nr:T9SS type A sorting domain-containing protein [Flavobacteriales bacterium]
MKHFIALALLSFSITAQATVHVVTCQNGTHHFLPVTVNAVVGDTIHWTWVSGNHVVGPILETDIPPLADTWFAVIDASYNTYDYVVAYPGTYHYVCHPLSPHGEDGYIEVALNTAVPAEPSASATRLYPDPFTEQLTVEASGATSVSIHDLLGQEVRTYSLAGRNVLRADLGTLPEGIYLVSILKNGVVMETRRVEKQ